MPRKISGPMYMLMAAVFWSFAGLCAKFIPWHPLSISAVRGPIAAITVMCARRQWRIKLSRTTVMAALCMCATTVLFMFANKLTSAANAIVLQYTAPAYVLVATALIRKAKFRPVDVFTVVFTLGGIVLFFVDHMGQGALLGDVLALLSGLTFAGVFFFNGLPSSNPEDASVLGCALSGLFFPMVFMDTQVVTAGLEPWIVVIAMGVVQLGLAYFFFAKGVQQTGSVTAAVISSCEPILNPIWVFLAMGERPGTLSIIGGAIVILTICVYNLWNAKNAADANHPLKRRSESGHFSK